MLSGELKRLGAQTAVYGTGGMLTRLVSVALIPIYTVYLGRTGFGKLETILALIAVLSIALRFGVGNAFFRFYFDADESKQRGAVVHSTLWFTMASATLVLAAGVLLAGPLAHWLGLGDPWLVRLGFVWLWATVNTMPLTGLLRAEERPIAFVVASLATVILSVGAVVGLVIGGHAGARGAVGGYALGNLVVYAGLLVFLRRDLGWRTDLGLIRAMNRFGLPLVPAALGLWVINFVDRLFIATIKGQAEVGIYSLAVRISSLGILLLSAFQLAWPAYVYGQRDDDVARRISSYALTYLVLLCCWIAVASGTLAPWLVSLLAPHGDFARSAEAVAPLCFGTAAYAGYAVLSVALARAGHTKVNWVVAGAAALVNIALNAVLVPLYGMMGAAIATLVAYVVLFAGIWVRTQRVHPLPYQWRRVLTAAGAAGALTAVGAALHSLPVAAACSIAYPLLLLALGFFERAELSRAWRLLAPSA